MGPSLSRARCCVYPNGCAGLTRVCPLLPVEFLRSFPMGRWSWRWQRLQQQCAVLLATVLLWGGASMQAYAFTSAPDDANLLLLAVHLERQVLTDSLTVYQEGDMVLLPLGQLARVLTLAIRTDPQHGYASGFITRPEQTFALDVASASVTIIQQEQAFALGHVRVYPDDIYVDRALLEQWLPLSLRVNFAALVLEVVPREPLPLQLRLARQQVLAGLGRAQPGEAEPYRRYAIPREQWAMPAVDQSANAMMHRTPAGTTNELITSTYMTGDFSGMESSLFTSLGGAGSTRQVRWTLGRHDLEGMLLGPLGARTLLMGSLPPTGMRHVSLGGPEATGMVLSNQPLGQPTSVDHHTLQGDLPPGWDVELYYNGALVDHQAAQPNGRYLFSDRPLLFGNNEFRLVFHGPEGQTRVETRTFRLQDTMPPPGALYYDLAALHDAHGPRSMLASVNTGIAPGLAASAGSYHTQWLDQAQRYDSLGLRSLVKDVLLSMTAVHQQQGGYLSEVGMTTEVGSVSLGLSHLQLWQFSSPLYPLSTDPLRQRDKASLNGSFKTDWAPVGVAITVNQDRLQSGSRLWNANATTYAYLGASSVSHQLTWQSDATGHALSGVLQLGRYLANTGLRAQLGYQVTPTPRLGTIEASLERSLWEGWTFNVSAGRSMADLATQLGASLTKSLGTYGLSASVGFGSKGERAIGVRWFTSIGRDPRHDQWRFNALPGADTGRATVQVFVDKNGNGRRDDGEEPVAGVGFYVNGAPRAVRTDADGLAYLDQLPANQRVTITINRNTLEEPQWLPQPLGFELMLRPGIVAQLDLPVVATVEVEGTVYVQGSGAAPRPIGDVQLELVDRQGTIVGRATSASDGYYLMSGILPGTYTLRLDAEQGTRLQMQTGERVLSVGQEHLGTTTVDLVLTRQ